jgi:hypothetical protein
VLLFALSISAQTAQQWNADIDYLAAELPKRHPNPFTHVSREAFNAQLAALKAQTADLSASEIAIRLQQVIASLRDAHTELSTDIEPNTIFPLRLYRFADGIHVTKTTAVSRGACGAKLIAIDGLPAEEVYARVATTISAENEAWLEHRVPAAMVRAETLKTLGVIASAESATFTFESSGFRFALRLHAGSDRSVLEHDLTTPELPLYRQNPELPYWYRWLPESGLLYVKYNACVNDPANPFAALERDVLAIADAQNVAHFVIDVRDNGGGSTEVARGLIDAIARRPQLRGRLFVIIGRATFSSALFNAFDLRNAGARLVGEPTGGKLNAFGEVRSFVLPNSRLPLFHSTRLFTLVPGDDSPSLLPEIEVALMSTDFFRKRDPVLEAIAGRPLTLAVLGRRRAVGTGRSCPQ